MPDNDPASDAWLDAELRRVTVPAGMRARLARLADDELARLDERLRDVELPADLRMRLLRLARSNQWTPRRLALAASLMIGVGLWYAGMLATLLGGAFAPAPQPVEAIIAAMLEEPRHDGFELAWRAADEELNSELAAGLDLAARPSSLGFGGTTEAAVQPARLADDALRLVLRPQPWWNREVDLAAWQGAPPPVVDGGLLGQATAAPLADPREVVLPKARGVNQPLSIAGRLYLLEQGAFPPQTAAARAETEVPLAVSDASFQQARQVLAAGAWPVAEEVRTEEFVAAHAYDYPRHETRPLEVVTHLGPYPWSQWSVVPGDNPPPVRLLQVGVQGRELPPRRRGPTQLTVLLDTSSSMHATGRMQRAADALRALVARLEPDDRLRLITYNQQVRVLIEDATAADRAALASAINSLSAAPGNQLADGLLAACAAAAADANVLPGVARVVLLTDGPTQVSRATLAQVGRLWSSTPANRLRLDAVDLREWSTGDSHLAELVAAGRGQIVAGGDARQLGWSLAEVLAGRSLRLADRVRVVVSFNPQSVAGFRLVGHEPNVLGELAEGEVTLDLYDGESATALLELQLTARPEAELGLVRVTWQSPRDGTERQLERRVLRARQAASVAEAPPPWQLAGLAAATGSWLRQSPLSAHYGPAELLAACDQLPAAAAAAPSMVQLRQLLEQAERLRQRRAPPPRIGR